MMVHDFTPMHLAAVRLQGAQAHEMVSIEEAEHLTTLGPAWSYLRGEKVKACGGFVPVSPTVAIAWSYIAQDAGQQMTWLAREAKHALDACPYERVDCLVLDGFKPGMRFAKMLKFTFTSQITMKSRDGQTRVYNILSRGRGNGWH